MSWYSDGLVRILASMAFVVVLWTAAFPALERSIYIDRQGMPLDWAGHVTCCPSCKALSRWISAYQYRCSKCGCFHETHYTPPGYTHSVVDAPYMKLARSRSR